MSETSTSDSVLLITDSASLLFVAAAITSASIVSKLTCFFMNLLCGGTSGFVHLRQFILFGVYVNYRK